MSKNSVQGLELSIISGISEIEDSNAEQFSGGYQVSYGQFKDPNGAAVGGDTFNLNPGQKKGFVRLPYATEAIKVSTPEGRLVQVDVKKSNNSTSTEFVSGDKTINLPLGRKDVLFTARS